MQPMKTFAALALAIAMLFVFFPAPAQAHEEKSWSLNDVLNLGSRVLTDAIEKGVAEIQDHVEIDVNTGGGAHEGETSTQLRLKLFPKGKSHSDEEISAETTLKYLLDPKQPYLNFDIRITPKKSSLDPDDYI
jgi:preprotein translocase subunit YajC